MMAAWDPARRRSARPDMPPRILIDLPRREKAPSPTPPPLRRERGEYDPCPDVTGEGRHL